MPPPAHPPQVPVEIALLGQHPELIAQVALLRWQEWGDEEATAEHWVEVTAAESQVGRLPTTLVAIDAEGKAVGAVALGEYDDALTDAERSGRTPWLLGLVVDPDLRGHGAGRRLVAEVEDLARGFGHVTMWVATGPQARDFYVGGGWHVRDEFALTKGGWPSFVLERSL